MTFADSTHARSLKKWLLPLVFAVATPAVLLLRTDAQTGPSSPVVATAQTPLEANADLSPAAGQGAFLILSDVHFDPFVDATIVPRLASSPVEQWRNIFDSSTRTVMPHDSIDTPYPLLVSAIDAAKNSARVQESARFDYVLVTGDYLAHNFQTKARAAGLDDKDYADFASRTLVFVTRALQRAFPETPVILAFGNNDSTCGDYFAPGDAVLRTLSKEWKTVAARRDSTADFIAGGYYAVPHPTLPNRELIVLDTNFFSSNYHAGCSFHSGDPGVLELRWLRGKLRQLRRAHKTATLVMHIPPGMDGFATARNAACAKPTLLWKRQYLDSFLQITREYKDVLVEAYAGHFHRDDFRVIADAKGNPFLPVHVVPAISPNYSNNPSFEIGYYGKSDGVLADYSVIYLKKYFAQGALGTSPEWTGEYRFSRAYAAELHGSSGNAAGLSALASAIQSDPAARAKFDSFYEVESPVRSDISDQNWRYFACAHTNMTVSGYGVCACPPAAPGP